ncbi:Ras and EF-hand domain-containing protein, partial [Eudyptes chrysolophus]
HAGPARARSCSGSSPMGWQSLHQQQGSPRVAGLAQPHSSDTPGPRYRSIAQSYFHKAHGVLLLYDISSQSSFLSICQWIEDIRAHNSLFCETSTKDGTNVVEAVLHLAQEVKRMVGQSKDHSAGLDLSIPPRAAPRCC